MKLFVVLSFLAVCALSAPQGGHRDLRPTVSEIEVIPVDNSLPEDLSRGHYEVIEITPVETPRNNWFRRWFNRIFRRKPVTATTTTPAPTSRPRTLEDDIAINYVGPLPRENPDAEIFDVELFNEDARRHSSGLSQPIRSQPLMSQPVWSQPLISQPIRSQPMMAAPLRPQPRMSEPLRYRGPRV